MNNNFFSTEIIGILKMGFAQLLAGVIFIVTGILNLKKNRKFSLLVLFVGLLFISFTFLFDKMVFNENNIPGRLNILAMMFGLFMLGIPQILVGIPLMFIGISRILRPQNRKSGILFLVLSCALIFTFAWFLIFSGGSGM